MDHVDVELAVSATSSAVVATVAAPGVAVTAVPAAVLHLTALSEAS